MSNNNQKTQTQAETNAYNYLRAVQNPDSRIVREFMRGRSVAFREQVKAQLKAWSCYEQVPVRLLNVEPRPQREGRMTLQQLQAHLRLRQSGWDTQTDRAMRRAVRVWVNGGSLDDVIEEFDEVIREG